MGDDALLADLKTKLAPLKERRILVTVKYGQIPRLNLALLRHLLAERKEPGVYVSVDRPHKYTELLLRRSKIPHDGLTFVDIVTRGGGSRLSDTKSMLSVGGFFWLKLLSGSFPEVYVPGSDKQATLELGGKKFLLLDNVAILPAYNSENSIREFFYEFGNVLDKHKGLRAFLVTHTEVHPTLLEILEGFSDIVLEIGGDW